MGHSTNPRLSDSTFVIPWLGGFENQPKFNFDFQYIPL